MGHLFYNGSLIFSNAIENMVWYNYLSWICEHSLVPLLGVIYIVFFYQKYDVGSDGNKHWLRFKELVYSMLPLFIYHFIFIALGFILKATDAFPLFGDMSSTGWFPYEYMDFSNTNTRVHADWLQPWSQFLGTMAVFLIEQIAVFYLLAGLCHVSLVRQGRKPLPVK